MHATGREIAKARLPRAERSLDRYEGRFLDLLWSEQFRRLSDEEVRVARARMERARFWVYWLDQLAKL